MFSVRLTTTRHTETNLYVLGFILFTVSVLTYFDVVYSFIFLSSTLFHVIIESGLYLAKIRKGDQFFRARKLPKPLEILIRSGVEGPAFCVPAFYIANHRLSSFLFLHVIGVICIVGAASFFLGWFDRKHAKTVNKDEIIVSRRAMTKPKGVMLLALINSICILVIMTLPDKQAPHAYVYFASYAGLVLLFYFINYNLGVRYIELYNAAQNSYERPPLAMQISGLIYDSAYEMTLLISPVYWAAYYIGVFS
jgi:hypothetical protein